MNTLKPLKHYSNFNQITFSVASLSFDLGRDVAVHNTLWLLSLDVMTKLTYGGIPGRIDWTFLFQICRVGTVDDSETVLYTVLKVSIPLRLVEHNAVMLR